MKNIYRILGTCLLTAAISVPLSSCKKQEPAAPPPTPEQKAAIEEMKKDAAEARKVYAARVNGSEITMFDLVREMNRVVSKYAKPGEAVAPAITRKVKKEALDNLIFNELAIQEAVRQKITVSPDVVETVVKQMKDHAGSKEKYQEYLDNMGVTEEGLRKRIERGHLLEAITAKEIYQNITIDDKEMRAEYERNKSAYKAGDRQLSYEEASAAVKKKLIFERGAVKKQEWENILKKNARIEIAKDTTK